MAGAQCWCFKQALARVASRWRTDIDVPHTHLVVALRLHGHADCVLKPLACVLLHVFRCRGVSGGVGSVVDVGRESGVSSILRMPINISFTFTFIFFKGTYNY